MNYFTISEYARLTGTTRQAVQGKLRRKKLKLKRKPVYRSFIALTDQELEAVKAE